ncbi:DUF2975 domain-containing protein [Pelagibius sp. Alg239-R121]|uniref:DUF2975 domain-containing protein n=1 Tax=Pelagibius sp. Alg239-R121 TaxID=2993448 RepID=UPI0024A72A2E|nr:DUF2975 domain-containing protein [Pelagibius sp. Alg239-R121]
MDGIDHQISRFSHRIRMGLFALLGVIAVATLLALVMDKGTVWLGIDGINLGVVSGDGGEFGEAGQPGEETAEEERLLEAFEDRLEWVLVTQLLLTASFYILLVFQLERLFAAYQRGELFSQMNARRIRNIGLLFCVAAGIAILDSLLDLYITQEFMAASTEVDRELDWDLVREIRLPLPFLLGGVAIVLIARVMEKGAQLQDEMDHLI